MSLTDMCNKITLAVDKNKLSIGVFVDLSKALDNLDHRILLLKLEFYGIRGMSLEWFKSYFSGRKHYVVLHSVSSRQHDITYGVPQGSILGPLLFILYNLHQ